MASAGWRPTASPGRASPRRCRRGWRWPRRQCSACRVAVIDGRAMGHGQGEQALLDHRHLLDGRLRRARPSRSGDLEDLLGALDALRLLDLGDQRGAGAGGARTCQGRRTKLSATRSTPIFWAGADPAQQSGPGMLSLGAYRPRPRRRSRRRRSAPPRRAGARSRRPGRGSGGSIACATRRSTSAARRRPGCRSAGAKVQRGELAVCSRAARRCAAWGPEGPAGSPPAARRVPPPRGRAARSRRSAAVPWEKFSRATSMPASKSPVRTSTSRDRATILVRRSMAAAAVSASPRARRGSRAVSSHP